MVPKDKIHWLRFILSSLGGITSGLLNLSGESAGEVIMMMVFLYILSIYIIIYILKITPLASNISLKELFISGTGTFIINWLFLWILVYNILILL